MYPENIIRIETGIIQFTMYLDTGLIFMIPFSVNALSETGSSIEAYWT